MPERLSVFIIAKDEERDLPGALESVHGLADEIVVLVSEDSRDRTEDLAKEAGARVFRRRFDGYAGQKQAALDAATLEWVLSLDADERVSSELRSELTRALPEASPSVAGFQIPFAVHFMGRRLRFGGLGREKHLRLFRRTKGRFQGGLLHEGVTVDGEVSELAGRIHHHPYRDLSEYLSKLDRYTTLAARKRFERGDRFHWWHHLILPGELFVRAVLKLAFLDGRPGLVWAGLSAFHSWLKYVKLSEVSFREPSQMASLSKAPNVRGAVDERKKEESS